MRLQGKIAMITGGARGIGLATATRFAREGARICLADLDREAGLEAEATLGKDSPGSFFAPLDVCDREAVGALVEEIRKRWGRLDILINNAGVTSDRTLANMTTAEWDRVIDTNLKGAFHCTQAAAGPMREQGDGRIVSAASVVAHYGNFGQSNYVAAKAGIIGLTRVWARELGPKGIRVNAIAPGFIDTRMARAVPADALENFRAKTPLGRLGRPEEVAAAYLFLASDEASYVNGAVLNVDGGLVF